MSSIEPIVISITADESQATRAIQTLTKALDALESKGIKLQGLSTVDEAQTHFRELADAAKSISPMFDALSKATSVFSSSIQTMSEQLNAANQTLLSSLTSVTEGVVSANEKQVKSSEEATKASINHARLDATYFAKSVEQKIQALEKLDFLVKKQKYGQANEPLLTNVFGPDAVAEFEGGISHLRQLQEAYILLNQTVTSNKLRLFDIANPEDASKIARYDAVLKEFAATVKEFGIEAAKTKFKLYDDAIIEEAISGTTRYSAALDKFKAEAKAAADAALEVKQAIASNRLRDFNLGSPDDIKAIESYVSKVHELGAVVRQFGTEAAQKAFPLADKQMFIDAAGGVQVYENALLDLTNKQREAAQTALEVKQAIASNRLRDFNLGSLDDIKAIESYVSKVHELGAVVRQFGTEAAQKAFPLADKQMFIDAAGGVQVYENALLDLTNKQREAAQTALEVKQALASNRLRDFNLGSPDDIKAIESYVSKVHELGAVVRQFGTEAAQKAFPLADKQMFIDAAGGVQVYENALLDLTNKQREAAQTALEVKQAIASNRLRDFDLGNKDSISAIENYISKVKEVGSIVKQFGTGAAEKAFPLMDKQVFIDAAGGVEVYEKALEKLKKEQEAATQADKVFRAQMSKTRDWGLKMNFADTSKENLEVMRKTLEDVSKFKEMVNLGHAPEKILNTDRFIGYDPEKLKAASSALNELMEKHRQVSDSAKVNKEVHNSLNTAMGDLRGVTRGLSGVFGNLWVTYGSIVPLLLTAGFAGAAKSVAQIGAEMQKQLALIKAINLFDNFAEGGKFTEDMAKFNQDLANMGMRIASFSKDSMHSMEQVTTGIRELTQAGFKINEAFDLTPTVLNLATVGELTVKQSAKFLAGIRSSFALQNSEVSHAADVTAFAAAKSQTSIEEMSSSMTAASVVAAEYGLKIEDASIMLMKLAERNVTGSAAGTALKNFMTDLAGRTEKSRKALNDLGISLYSLSTGALRPTADVVDDLRKKLSNMSDQAKERALRNIFDERGLKEASVMLSMTTEEYQKLRTEMRHASDNMGMVNTAAGILNNTLSNQSSQAVHALQASLLSVFSSLEPTLISMAKTLKELFSSDNFKAGLTSLTSLAGLLASSLLGVVDALNKMNVAFPLLTVAVSAWLAKTFAATAGLKAFQVSVYSTAAAVGELNAAQQAATAFSWGKFLANPYVLAGAAVIALVAGIYEAYTAEQEFNKELKKTYESVKPEVFAVNVEAYKSYADSLNQVFDNKRNVNDLVKNAETGQQLLLSLQKQFADEHSKILSDQLEKEAGIQKAYADDQETRNQKLAENRMAAARFSVESEIALSKQVSEELDRLYANKLLSDQDYASKKLAILNELANEQNRLEDEKAKVAAYNQQKMLQDQIDSMGFFETVWGAIKLTFQSAWENLSTLASLHTKYTKELWNSMVTFMKDKFEAFISWFSEKINGVKTLAKDFATSLLPQATTNAFGQGLDFVTNGLAKIGKQASDTNASLMQLRDKGLNLLNPVTNYQKDKQIVAYTEGLKKEYLKAAQLQNNIKENAGSKNVPEALIQDLKESKERLATFLANFQKSGAVLSIPQKEMVEKLKGYIALEESQLQGLLAKRKAFQAESGKSTIKAAKERLTGKDNTLPADRPESINAYKQQVEAFKQMEASRAANKAAADAAEKASYEELSQTVQTEAGKVRAIYEAQTDTFKAQKKEMYELALLEAQRNDAAQSFNKLVSDTAKKASDAREKTANAWDSIDTAMQGGKGKEKASVLSDELDKLQKAYDKLSKTAQQTTNDQKAQLDLLAISFSKLRETAEPVIRGMADDYAKTVAHIEELEAGLQNTKKLSAEEEVQAYKKTQLRKLAATREALNARFNLEIEAMKKVSGYENTSEYKKLLDGKAKLDEVYLSNRNALEVEAALKLKDLQNKEWQATVDKIENVFHEGWNSILEKGASGWKDFTKKLATMFKQTVMDAIYKTFVQKYVINLVANVGGIFGFGGQSAAGNALGDNPIVSAIGSLGKLFTGGNTGASQESSSFLGTAFSSIFGGGSSSSGGGTGLVGSIVQGVSSVFGGGAQQQAPAANPVMGIAQNLLGSYIQKEGVSYLSSLLGSGASTGMFVGQNGALLSSSASMLPEAAQVGTTATGATAATGGMASFAAAVPWIAAAVALAYGVTANEDKHDPYNYTHARIGYVDARNPNALVRHDELSDTNSMYYAGEGGIKPGNGLYMGAPDAVVNPDKYTWRQNVDPSKYFEGFAESKKLGVLVGAVDQDTMGYGGQAFNEGLAAVMDSIAGRMSKTQQETAKQNLVNAPTTQFFTGADNSSTEGWIQAFGSRVYAESLVPVLNALDKNLGDIVKPYMDQGPKQNSTLDEIQKLLNAVMDLYDKKDAFGIATSAFQGLADAAGGFDKLNSSLNSYYDKFYSEEEKRALSLKLNTERVASGMTTAFEAFGKGKDTMPKTTEEFRAMMDGIDKSTTAGQNFYVAMLDIAPAFADMANAAKEAATKLKSSTEAFTSMFGGGAGKQGQLAGFVAKGDSQFGLGLKQYKDNGVMKNIPGNSVDYNNPLVLQNRVTKTIKDELAARSLGQGTMADTELQRWLDFSQEIANVFGDIAEQLREAYSSLVDEYGTEEEKNQQRLAKFSSGWSAVWDSFPSAKAQMEAMGLSMKDVMAMSGRQFLDLVNKIKTTYGEDSALYQAILALAPAWREADQSAQHAANAINSINTSVDLGKSAEDAFQRMKSDVEGNLQKLYEKDALGGYIAQKDYWQSKITQAQQQKGGASAYDQDHYWAPLIAKLQKQLDAVGQESMRFTTLSAQYGNDIAMQLVALERQHNAKMQELSWNAQAQAIENQLFQKMWDDIVNGTANGTKKTIDELKKWKESLLDWVNSVKLNKEVTTLTPMERMVQAQNTYNDILQKAKAGDSAAQDKLTGAADSYLQASREYFGSSSDYSAIFKDVIKNVEQLAQTATSSGTNEVIAATLQVVDAVKSGTESTNRILSQILNATNTGTTKVTTAVMDSGQKVSNATIASVVNTRV